jgi:phosphoribosyl 1,2-cyclic phosphodiesterase
MIDRFMQRPFFPVGPEVFRAKVAMHDFDPGAVLTPCDGVVIRTALLDHPGRAVGYRIEFAGRVVAMVFDTCHQIGELDPVVMDLIRDADLFLYDATFTDAEFPTFAHFGHSTWQQAVRLAQAAGAARVGLIHHATFRTDDELAQIEQEAQVQFPGAFCGRDTQVITL